MMNGGTESAASSLCDGLVAEILIRVPPKTLSRCKCVSKSWKILISHASFVQALKSLPPISAGFFFSPGSRYWYYHSLTNTINNKVTPRILASHNGFAFGIDVPKSAKVSQYLVCNPYTKQWVYLPRSRNLYRVRDNGFDLFCYEKQESVEFKVLGFRSPLPRYGFVRVHIYSSETGEWTFSELFLPEVQPNMNSVYLWKPRTTLSAPDSVYLWQYELSQVGVYDLNKGSVRLIQKPGADIPYSNQHLGVSAGSVYFAEMGTVSIRVWLHAKGDEWSLEHVVSFEEVPILKLNPSFRIAAFHPTRLGLVLTQPSYVEKFCMYGVEKVFMYDVDSREIELIPDADRALKYMNTIVPYLLPAFLPCLINPNSLTQCPRTLQLFEN